MLNSNSQTHWLHLFLRPIFLGNSIGDCILSYGMKLHCVRDASSRILILKFVEQTAALLPVAFRRLNEQLVDHDIESWRSVYSIEL
jgi:hypothetical protein